MKRDAIAEAGVDVSGRLYVVPTTARFPLIYREAMGVNWDDQRQRLRSDVPRQWSLQRWFEQILAATQAQGWLLKATTQTAWIGLPEGFVSQARQNS